MNGSSLDKSHNFDYVSTQNLYFGATSKKVVLECRAFRSDWTMKALPS